MQYQLSRGPHAVPAVTGPHAVPAVKVIIKAVTSTAWTVAASNLVCC